MAIGLTKLYRKPAKRIKTGLNPVKHIVNFGSSYDQRRAKADDITRQGA
jgi:hypothetical protein